MVAAPRTSRRAASRARSRTSPPITAIGYRLPSSDAVQAWDLLDHGRKVAVAV
jgi:hypothetical protein